MNTNDLEKITNRLRYLILKITHQVGSGHPTTCFSSVELLVSLFFRHLKFDPDHPENPLNDRFILSKGHASALLYSLYHVAGAISEKELMTYRQFGSNLEGHPTCRFQFAEAATGSLGQGLSIGAGMAWGIRQQLTVDSSRLMPKKNNEDVKTAEFDASVEPVRIPGVYVLMGDGEMAEGSVWEVVQYAGFKKIPNLTVIVDLNRFGQSDETMWGTDAESVSGRFEAFGWKSLIIDGHSIQEINIAYDKAINYQAGPCVIIAKTIKGKGITYWEDKNGFHNKMLPDDELRKALRKFGKDEYKIKGVIAKPDQNSLQSSAFSLQTENDITTTNYELPARRSPVKPDEDGRTTNYTSPIPTKLAFGNALVRLGKTHPNLMVLDGDVANSLHTDIFRIKFPDRFIQIYIAEQNMVTFSIGLSKTGYIPVVNTFGAFLTRAHDQFRMAPLSDATIMVNGSYNGVSLGRDGPSQMGLEDIALFRSIFGSTVLYPSDPYQTEKLAELMLKQNGVVYMRTTREPTPVIYNPDDEFKIGGSRIFEPPATSHPPLTTNSQPITVIAAGITLHEALKARQELAGEKIAVRVIDCYSIKPIDVKALRNAARKSAAIVVVEDHFPEGGLGESVMSALQGRIPCRIYHLPVKIRPVSGSAGELLAYAGIDASGIIKCVRNISRIHKENTKNN